jgi:hypothetical protein
MRGTELQYTYVRLTDSSEVSFISLSASTPSTHDDSNSNP